MRRLIAVSLFAMLVACGGGAHTVPTTAPSVSPSSDSGSALYVADVRSANVVHVNSAGAPQLTLQGGIAPAGVGVTSTGDVVVAGNQQSVLYFHPQSPTPFNSFTSSDICGAKGVALDFGDNVYVGDVICPQVWRFKAGTNGPNAAPSASLSWDKSTYGGLLAFDADPAGNVYVLTGDSDRALWILIYQYEMDASGHESFKQFAKITAGSAFPNANGITVDGDRDVYVVNGDKTLLEYTPTGDTATPYTLAWTTGLDGLCNTYAIRHAAVSDGTSTRNLLYAAEGCGGPSGSQIIAYTIATPDPLLSPSPSPTPFTIAVSGPGETRGITEKSTIAIDQSSGSNGGSVYVATPLADIVSGYCAGCIDKAPPSVQFSLGYPGMDGIQALWFDNGLLYTMDAAAPAITVYAAPSKHASGIEAPVPLARILGQSMADMCGLAYVLTDAQHNLLATLACPEENYVAKYTLPSNVRGNIVLPATVFAGTKGNCSAGNPLCNPQQMAMDKSGNLYVTNYGMNPKVNVGNGSVVKFSSTGALEAIMVSPDIHNPSGVAIDPQGNIAVLSNLKSSGTPEIAFFAPAPNQASPMVPIQVTALRTISGGNTQIGAGTDTPFPPMQIDTDGTIYVNEYNDILVFSPGSSGNVSPKAVYQDNGQMTGGTGIALQP